MVSTKQLSNQAETGSLNMLNETSADAVSLDARRLAKQSGRRSTTLEGSPELPSPRVFCARLRDEVIQGYDRLDGPTRHVAGLATFLADRDLELSEFENVLGTLAKSAGTPELSRAAKRILTRWRPYRRQCA